MHSKSSLGKRMAHLLCCGCLGLTLVFARASFSDEVVFSEITSNAKITVIRREVPYVPPTAAEKEALLKAVPGARIIEIKPDRVGEFSLYRQEIDEAVPRLLWRKTVPEKTRFGIPDLPFTIYDVDVPATDLVIVYRHNRFIEAEVKSNSAPIDNNYSTMDKLLVRESDSMGSPVVSADVLRSKIDSMVIVRVRHSDGSVQQFVRDNQKWVQAETREATTLFQKTYAVGDSRWILEGVVDPASVHAYTRPDGSTYTSGRGVDLRVIQRFTGEKERGPSVLWNFWKIRNPISPPANWSMDACFMPQNAMLYVAVSSGERFWIQPVPVRYVKESGELATSDFLVESSETQRIDPPADILSRSPYTEKINIKHVDDELVVFLGNKEQESSTWRYNVHSRAWRAGPVGEPVAEPNVIKIRENDILVRKSLQEAGIIGMSGPHESQIFTLPLSDHTKLVLLHSVLQPSDSSDINKSQMAASQPGSIVSKPVRSDLYRYTLVADNEGAAPIQLWSEQVDSYSTESRGLKFIDLFYHNNVLMSVFVQNGMIKAEVILCDTTKQTGKVLIASQLEAEQKSDYVVNSTVKGLGTAETVSITLNHQSGKKTSYHAKNGAWVKN